MFHHPKHWVYLVVVEIPDNAKPNQTESVEGKSGSLHQVILKHIRLFSNHS